jgi:4,5-DOPA dioxygenase extradiol
MHNYEVTPTVFFGHGSPTTILDDRNTMDAWSGMAQTIGKPKAILCVSAHWCTQGIKVTAMEQPPTIHDFGRGLPAQLFDVQYPAPGDIDLAERVRDILAPLPVELDQDWGLDHAAWTVLSVAYPEADVPVIQLSMDARKPISWHFELGRKLRPLREEGILILGSGNVVHTLAQMEWNIHAKPHDWADRFNDLVINVIETNTPERLFDHEALGHDAAMSIPPQDLGHYWPLFYVLGARHDEDKVTINPKHVQYKSLSMMSFLLDCR